MKKVARLRIMDESGYHHPSMTLHTTTTTTTPSSISAYSSSGRDSNGSDGMDSGRYASGVSEMTNSVRTTGRIKKPKAVFDPSDNYLPRARPTGNSTSSVFLGVNNGNQIISSGIGGISSSNDSMERRKSFTSLLQQQQQQRNNNETNQASSIASKKSIRAVQTTTTTTTNSSIDKVIEPIAPIITPDAVCCVCQKREAKRGTHAKNKLITCLNCEKRVHKLCLKSDFEDLDVLRQNFKCDDCRTCNLCDAFDESEDADFKDENRGELVTCSKCVKSYHPICHIPSVLPYQQQQRNWKCNMCTDPVSVHTNNLLIGEREIREIIGGKALSQHKRTIPQQQSVKIDTVSSSSTSKRISDGNSTKRLKQDGSKQATVTTNGSSIIEKKRGKVEISDESESPQHKTEPIRHYSTLQSSELPNVEDWSVDEVVNFFTKYFPDEAYVFKDQEIDGASLLLLKRSDVIKKFSIKLGPSLRIFHLILMLQTRTNDPTLAWNGVPN